MKTYKTIMENLVKSQSLEERVNEMRVCLLGGGLASCSLGRLLLDKGHEVTIIEKESDIGGLCKTHFTEDALPYEEGGHIFHTKDQEVIDFLKRFTDLRELTHYVGVKLVPEDFKEPIKSWPITDQTIDMLTESEQIRKELANLPDTKSKKNFEECVKSMIGETLYTLFVKNYTSRMWHRPPNTMSAEWAPKRIRLGGNDDRLFGDEKQFYPFPNFNELFRRMTTGIKVMTNTPANSLIAKSIMDESDVIVSTIPIDELFGYGNGKLQYVGLNHKFNIISEKDWYSKKHGTINFPNSSELLVPLRTTNYNMINGYDGNGKIVIGADYPTTQKRHYFVKTDENEKRFMSYLNNLCMNDKIVGFGRLGLGKYLDMCPTIKMAMEYVDFVEKYRNMDEQERLKKYIYFRNKY